jgi:hypothetical protein
MGFNWAFKGLMEPYSFSNSRQLSAVMVIKKRLFRQLYLCVGSKLCIQFKSYR